MADNTFTKALAEIQHDLNAPKSQYNSFGKYNYRSCEDILSALKPLLKEHGMTIVLSDEIVGVGDRYYIKATATLSNGSSSLSNSAFAREDEVKKGMDGAQITGTASSYARKYALNGMFAIDDQKDADTDENKLQQQNAPLTCPKCGSVVKGKKLKTGEIITAEQVLEKCGGVCTKCYKAAKEAEKEQAADLPADYEEVKTDD